MALGPIGGNRPNFQTYTNPNKDVSYPKAAAAASPTGAANSGRGTQQAVADGGLAADGANNPLQILSKLVQVIAQLFSALAQLFGAAKPGGTAGAPGGPEAAGAPGGAPGGAAPGGLPDINPGAAGGVGTPGGATQSGVPWISQYSPAGAENGYSNGAANCGPTSAAMFARSIGYGKGMSDAQLINDLGQAGGTTADGSSINGIIAMADHMGANSEVHGPKADTAWIDQQLAQGHTVMANGDYYSEPGHTGAGPSGHYLDVVGKDANGNYQIQDPADGGIKTMTAAELSKFINNNPVNGGYCVALWK